MLQKVYTNTYKIYMNMNYFSFFLEGGGGNHFHLVLLKLMHMAVIHVISNKHQNQAGALLVSEKL